MPPSWPSEPQSQGSLRSFQPTVTEDQVTPLFKIYWSLHLCHFLVWLTVPSPSGALPCRSVPLIMCPPVQARPSLPKVPHFQTHLHLHTFAHPVFVPGMYESTTCEALSVHLPLDYLLTKTRMSLGQESANYGQQGKSNPLPVFINAVLLERNHACCLCIVCSCFPSTIQSSLKKIFANPCSRPLLCQIHLCHFLAMIDLGNSTFLKGDNNTHFTALLSRLS